MTHHTCGDCQRGFVATSYDEAREEYDKMPDTPENPKGDFDELVELNELAYARACPYCASTRIRAI